MTNPEQTIQAQASVPLPSADLITYRFDQNDKKLEELSIKLDKIANGLATKEELHIVAASVSELKAQVEKHGKIISDIKIIRRLVYGAAGLILISVFGTIVALAFKAQ